MANITSEKEFEDWLKQFPEDQLKRLAPAMASRFALRVFPNMAEFVADKDYKQNIRHNLTLTSLNASLISCVAGTSPTQDIIGAALSARSAALSALSANSAALSANSAAHSAALSANSAALSANSAAHSAALSALSANSAAHSADSAARSALSAHSAAHSADSAARSAESDIWQAINSDAAKFETNGLDIQTLLNSPLWPNGIPDWAHQEWQNLKKHLLAHPQEKWSWWVTWYDDLLQGRPRDFELEEQIGLLIPDYGDKGPKVLNGKIEEILAERRQDNVDENNEDGVEKLPPQSPAAYTYETNASDQIVAIPMLGRPELEVNFSDIFENALDATADWDSALKAHTQTDPRILRRSENLLALLNDWHTHPRIARLNGVTETLEHYLLQYQNASPESQAEFGIPQITTLEDLVLKLNQLLACYADQIRPLREAVQSLNMTSDAITPINRAIDNIAAYTSDALDQSVADSLNENKSEIEHAEERAATAPSEDERDLARNALSKQTSTRMTGFRNFVNKAATSILDKLKAAGLAWGKRVGKGALNATERATYISALSVYYGLALFLAGQLGGIVQHAPYLAAAHSAFEWIATYLKPKSK